MACGGHGFYMVFQVTQRQNEKKKRECIGGVRTKKKKIKKKIRVHPTNNNTMCKMPGDDLKTDIPHVSGFFVTIYVT